MQWLGLKQKRSAGVFWKEPTSFTHLSYKRKSSQCIVRSVGTGLNISLLQSAGHVADLYSSWPSAHVAKAWLCWPLSIWISTQSSCWPVGQPGPLQRELAVDQLQARHAAANLRCHMLHSTAVLRTTLARRALGASIGSVRQSDLHVCAGACPAMRMTSTMSLADSFTKEHWKVKASSCTAAFRCTQMCVIGMNARQQL